LDAAASISVVFFGGMSATVAGRTAEEGALSMLSGWVLRMVLWGGWRC